MFLAIDLNRFTRALMSGLADTSKHHRCAVLHISSCIVVSGKSDVQPIGSPIRDSACSGHKTWPRSFFKRCIRSLATTWQRNCKHDGKYE